MTRTRRRDAMLAGAAALAAASASCGAPRVWLAVARRLQVAHAMVWPVWLLRRLLVADAMMDTVWHRHWFKSRSPVRVARAMMR